MVSCSDRWVRLYLLHDIMVHGTNEWFDASIRANIHDA